MRIISEWNSRRESGKSFKKDSRKNDRTSRVLGYIVMIADALLGCIKRWKKSLFRPSKRYLVCGFITVRTSRIHRLDSESTENATREFGSADFSSMREKSGEYVPGPYISHIHYGSSPLHVWERGNASYSYSVTLHVRNNGL